MRGEIPSHQVSLAAFRAAQQIWFRLRLCKIVVQIYMHTYNHKVQLNFLVVDVDSCRQYLPYFLWKLSKIRTVTLINSSFLIHSFFTSDSWPFSSLSLTKFSLCQHCIESGHLQFISWKSCRCYIYEQYDADSRSTQCLAFQQLIQKAACIVFFITNCPNKQMQPLV